MDSNDPSNYIISPRFGVKTKKTYLKKNHLEHGNTETKRLTHPLLEKLKNHFGYTPEDQHRTWKWWFGRWFSFSRGVFSGSMLILQGCIGKSPIHFLLGCHPPPRSAPGTVNTEHKLWNSKAAGAVNTKRPPGEGRSSNFWRKKLPFLRWFWVNSRKKNGCHLVLYDLCFFKKRILACNWDAQIPFQDERHY